MKSYVSKFIVLAVMLIAMCPAAWADVAFNEENFPDEAFREYISFYVDLDQDGSLSDEELALITDMNITYNVSSIEGIKLFTSLPSLYISEEHLTSLDVSGLTSLQKLTVYSEHLASLNVSGCTNLESMIYRYSTLTELDLTGCTSLRELYLSTGQLRELDLSGYTSLQKVDLTLGLSLRELNLSGCTSLQDIIAEMEYDGQDEEWEDFYNRNRLPPLKVDVSGCTSLQELNCRYIFLTALDASGCTSLKYLYCGRIPWLHLMSAGVRLCRS